MPIPIKTLLTSSSQSSGYTLAKSGISLKLGQKIACTFGFGFNKDSEKAKRASQFEALERLHTNYALHQEKTSFRGFLLDSPKEHRTFSLPEVLIRDSLIPGEKSADANGLGCHFDMNQAKFHAILELIERHLLAEIWYGNQLVFEIKDQELIDQGGWRFRTYMPAWLEVPLAITIINDMGNKVWVLGSALRESLPQSIEHAKNEALMLLESASHENGIAYSREIEKRINSLKNKTHSKVREEYFQTKVMNRAIVDSINLMSRQFTIQEIIFNSLGDSKLWIIQLSNDPHVNVVRAVSDAAKNPRWLRDSESKFIPLDPFC